MKSYLFVFVACIMLALITVTSCDKDDDEPVENSIVGTWEHVQSLEGFSMTVTMTFNADLTGTSKMVIVSGDDTETISTNFTYSTSGSTLTLKEGGDTEILTYSISGNQLTLSEDGENIVFTRK